MPPKKQRQPKPAPGPEPLFHEALGKQLSDKFMTIVDQQEKTTPLSRYFTEPRKPLMQVTRRISEESSSSDGTVQEVVVGGTEVYKTYAKDLKIREREKKKAAYILEDLNATQAIEELLTTFGRMTHMGVRDHAYQFFLNQSRTGVISYRLCGKVAVISGDPVCDVWQYQSLLKEFARFCKSNGWQYAMNGASKDMAVVAKEAGWSTIEIARERAVNVQTNPVLTGSEGKRIRTQCKQLMKNGTTIAIYSPAHQRNLAIERVISQIYEDWRAERNETTGPQAYVTVFDMFALPKLLTFIYSYNAEGEVTGFSALRRMKTGYHADPVIATASAPRGTVDLLLMASMALLKEAGVERLALGVEPLDELGEVTGMSKTLEKLTRRSHKMVTNELPLGGKKGFNDRFRPDENLEEPLFLIYPNSPSLRQQVAMAHFSNVQLHKALKQKYQREFDAKIKTYWKRKSEEGKVEEAAAEVAAVQQPTEA